MKKSQKSLNTQEPFNKIDKSKMVDSMGRPITQSLFLEVGYTDMAIFTLKENDYEYNGVIYPSLKKLYLEMGDVTEYEFANTFLLGWQHWKRICENKVIRKYIDEWREELEYKVRSKSVKALLVAAESGNYQAAKFFVDKGWDKRAAGRPSKAEIAREKEIQSKIADEYSADIVRLRSV